MPEAKQFLKDMTKRFAELAEEYDDEPFGKKVAKRYGDFLATGEFEKYEKLPGTFFDAPHTFKFLDARLVDHFATSEAYDSIRDYLSEADMPSFSLWPL